MQGGNSFGTVQFWGILKLKGAKYEHFGQINEEQGRIVHVGGAHNRAMREYLAARQGMFLHGKLLNPQIKIRSFQ